MIQTEWADGDSFEIQTGDGVRHTVRLYGADCFEWHVTDKSDAARLAAQRRYFGIAEYGGSPKSSIDAAKDLGKSAAEETARSLAKPFTVHTSFADARGDGRHKRIYAFITTSEGDDLAERLVRLGLARAFGVYRETPQLKSAKDYQEHLRDLELMAAKKGVGAWSKTNWDHISAERQEQRKEDAEIDLAADNVKTPGDFRINPNTAARDHRQPDHWGTPLQGSCGPPERGGPRAENLEIDPALSGLFGKLKFTMNPLLFSLCSANIPQIS